MPTATQQRSTTTSTRQYSRQQQHQATPLPFLEGALAALQQDRQYIDGLITNLQQRIGVRNTNDANINVTGQVGTTAIGSGGGVMPIPAGSASSSTTTPSMSQATRRKLSLAAKRRWAQAKRQGQTEGRTNVRAKGTKRRTQRSNQQAMVASGNGGNSPA